MSGVRRVLLIEDDDSIRDMVRMVLTDGGYEVLTAPHGRAALELVLTRPPSLILLDMRMPVMDGWEFSRAYRETPGPHAPMVVVTAARNAKHSAAEVGADGFLAKPFELFELLDLVERYTRSA